MNRRHRAEAGVALIWAILIMLVVLGAIAAAVAMTMVRTDETRAGANRTRSGFWAQAAADDIAQRLQSREIGYDLAAAPSAGTDGQDQYIVVPPTGLSGTTPSFANAGDTRARRLTSSSGVGWYQVLPPTGTTTPWRGVYRRSAARPGDQGAIEFYIRAWEDGAKAQPVTARLTYRHASFSRFSILADDHLSLGGLGTVVLGPYVHSNNSRSLGTAITYGSGVNLSATRNITTSTGAISPSCGAKCITNVRDVVEFGSGSRAMDRTTQLSSRTTPLNYAGVGVARTISTNLNGVATMHAGAGRVVPTVRVFWVNLGGCAANQLQYGTMLMKLREDTGGVPQIDDSQPPIQSSGGTCVAVAEGGGSYMFNGDVVVRGMRTSRYPVTILARRTPPTEPTVQLDIDGNGSWDSSRMTAPAGIYLWQTANGAGIGSQSAMAPVGLVAEGGVYAPSFAMRTENNTLNVRNVAAMAVGSEVSYGPSIISIAAENGDGLGLSPTHGRALGLGWGEALNWHGSIATRRPAVFRYGAGGTYLGYRTRSLSYPPELLWNPPPGFPNDRDWHLSDYREFRQ